MPSRSGTCPRTDDLGLREPRQVIRNPSSEWKTLSLSRASESRSVAGSGEASPSHWPGCRSLSLSTCRRVVPSITRGRQPVLRITIDSFEKFFAVDDLHRSGKSARVLRRVGRSSMVPRTPAKSFRNSPRRGSSGITNRRGVGCSTPAAASIGTPGSGAVGCKERARRRASPR